MTEDEIKVVLALTSDKRLPDLEEAIFNSHELTRLYLSKIARIVWGRGDVDIDCNISSSVYVYTKYYMEGKRWFVAEPLILRSPEYTYHYACEIIKDRWPEAETLIEPGNYWWTQYKHYFKIS